MSQGPSSGLPLNASAVTAVTATGSFENPRKALEAVGCAYDAWSANLTSTSLQMCYAVVAGDWLIFGSVDAIRKSRCGLLSLSMVLVALCVNMISAYVMSEWLRKTFEKAECDPDWGKKFVAASGQRDPYPFSKAIETVSKGLRLVKMLFPLLGGIALIIGALKSTPASATAQKNPLAIMRPCEMANAPARSK